MRLGHNMASLNIYQEYKKNIANQASALGKISSGNKVNRAGDNPNAISNSEKMRMQIRGLQMAQRNVQDGVSMLQTAEGGLENITSMMQRIRELTVKGATGTNTPEDKAIIQGEINQMIEGIDQIAKSTDMNGVNLIAKDLTDSKTSVEMTVGANVGEVVNIPRYNLVSEGDLKLKDVATGRNLIDVSDSQKASDSLKLIDSAIDTILSARSTFGALENRFESSYDRLGAIGDKIEGADSSVRDADIASEMVELSKDNILIQAGNAMMAQSNRFPQDILRVLDRR